MGFFFPLLPGMKNPDVMQTDTHLLTAVKSIIYDYAVSITNAPHVAITHGEQC